MKITTIILYSLIVTLGVFLLWYFIFKLYPYYLNEIYSNYSKNLSSDQNYGYNIGTFGDMYGALNSFLSGLAFIGLLATLVIQIIIHTREKKQNECDTLKSKQEKLIFLKNSLKYFIEEADELRKNVNIWHDTVINLEHNVIYKFEGSNIDYLFEILCKKIDLELYLTAYREYFEDEDFLSSLHHVHKLETNYRTFLSVVNQSIQYFNDTNLSYNNLCINCILQIDNVLLKPDIHNLGCMDQNSRNELLKKISREPNGKDLGPQVLNIIIMLAHYEDNKKVCLIYSKFLSQAIENEVIKIEETYKKIDIAISKF